jgi:hypothetical protein
VTKVRTWVGLDVHAVKVLACAVDADSGEMTVHRLPGEPVAVVAVYAGLPGPTRVACSFSSAPVLLYPTCISAVKPTRAACGAPSQRLVGSERNG